MNERVEARSWRNIMTLCMSHGLAAISIMTWNLHDNDPQATIGH